MFTKPQAEHHWLDQFIGRWTIEHDCTMPDGKKSNHTGTMNCRSLGGLWLICESDGQGSDGDWSSIMTLGFDPQLNQYVGTFIGSMMANIWPYRGVLDSSGRTLPLTSEGPNFAGEGTAQYRDTLLIEDKSTWHFNSEIQSADGSWVQIMSAKHTRL